jgi:hypothetical protein
VSEPLPSRALVWFGLLGAPGAWVAQHLTGYALTEAACNEAGRGWDVPIDALTAALTAAAAALAVLAGLAALAAFRSTRGAGGKPPAARVHFLGIAGIVVAPLFLAIIVMSGVGVIVLEGCRQG